MAEREENGKECAVCGEQQQQIVLSACGHSTCYECGTKWRAECSHKGTKSVFVCEKKKMQA